MRSTTLVTAPAADIVTLDEAKRHLRVSHHREDERLLRLLVSAREYVEHFTHRATLTQTWDLFLDCFPAVIDLPYPPLVSVTEAAFTYVATDGTSTQVPTARYTVDTDAEVGRIYEAYQQTWPTARTVEKAVTVRFVAGYGAAATALPAAMVDAALLHIENQYDHGGTSEPLQRAAEALLRPYQIGAF